MKRLLSLLLPLAVFLFGAQATWKEFSLALVTPKGPPHPFAAHHGALQAGSISVKSLIGIATGMPPTRVLGPDWIDTEHYRVTAVLSDESRVRMRTRKPGDTGVDEEFRSLFIQEIVSRFHLEFHQERRNSIGYLVQPISGGKLKAQKSTSHEGGGFKQTGTYIINVHTALDARGVTLPEFCNWLENRLKAPVTPSSALPGGIWDFRLKWQSVSQDSLLGAIRDQLGLDVKEANTPAEYLIVDRIERPGSTSVGVPQGAW